MGSGIQKMLAGKRPASRETLTTVPNHGTCLTHRPDAVHRGCTGTGHAPACGAIIGARTVVKRNIPAGFAAAGSPVRIICTL